jgi:dGTPase
VQPRARRFGIIRPPYAYDTDCILHNPFYSRYADKTQVFSFYKNDDLTRRALHVQFVSKIARTIGRALKLNLDLIEAIALGHDMGHTPFGHRGEFILSECYAKETGKTGTPRYFNHNVHSARIFRKILNENMSVQTLSGIISHNGEKVCKEYAPSKLKTFEEFDEMLENCYTDNQYHKHLRPNTLEGCVVRVSDMIAYAGRDRLDLYHAKLIGEAKFKESRLIGTQNSDYISNLIANIIKNSINSPSLNMDEAVFKDMEDFISENYQVIYSTKELNAPFEEIIKPLMFGLYERFIDDLQRGNEDSPVVYHYLKDQALVGCYDENTPHAEIVTDFIASMTDDYFIDVCRLLHIDDETLAKVSYREYF